MTKETFQIPFPTDRVLFPEFAEPSEVGHYSSDKQGTLHWDKSGLSTFAPPDNLEKLNLDLNDGFEQLIEQNHRLPGCLDNLLRWIIEESRRRSSSNVERNISLKDVVYGVDIVCWRGLFTKLAATPYERNENWLVGAVYFRGILFLMEFETEEKKAKNSLLTEKDKRMNYWGHRFERYVASSEDNDRSKSSNCVVDCNEHFCVIYRTKLCPLPNDSRSRQFRTLYGAEIDGIDERGRYIELKTSRVVDGWRQEQNFRKFKLLKWWLQAFLAGIDRVICGHRDDAGIIKYLKNYDVNEMPRSAMNGTTPFWTGANCFSFLYDLLVFMEKNMTPPDQPECLSEIVVFEFHPQIRQIRVMKNHSFTSDQVVPDWFVAAFGKT